ncbi:MAG TPA: iron-siderophore ABC transporter substrate-binding protein [candidate division Zixibacteria bacterium]|nr:iron-siderophore ABC transporter substrate-binding protein [candidate division Zixibacteria bacterium]
MIQLRFPTVSTILTAALLLTACGPAGSDATPSAASPTAEATTNQAAFPRTIEHAAGRTTIPERPERVVVLDTGELDSMIALGIVPVGAVRAPVEDGLLDYLQDDTEGVTELVGTIDEPNLERIAALQPDLILSSVLRHEALYDELSQIAPTVFTETVGVVWKENFLVHAEAVGLEARAEQLLADYEARADELGARLADELGALPTVSIVRFLPGETRLYQKASFIGTVLADVGLPRPESQDVDGFALVISEEQIALADGDVIFITSYGPTEESTQPTFTSNPLWDTLAAVQAGAVHEVPDDIWMLGIGIGAANLVLDDLERYLLESAP